MLGVGGLEITSHRTQLAVLADTIKSTNPSTVQKVAELWVDQFWAAYTDPNSGIAPQLATCKALEVKSPYASGTPPDPTMRTEAEEAQFNALRG